MSGAASTVVGLKFNGIGNKKRANANGMEAAMAIKEFRIGNRKMEFPFIYANPFTSSGLAAFVPYLYLYQIP